MSTSPPRTHYQIKRKPPPPHDISEKYPSPDPSDPFASLSALRNRTTSGLESDIVNRARSDPHLYSTTTAQVPANIAFPPISNKSSPLAFQPDLLHRELPSTHRHTKVRFPRRTYDLNDSGTESDDNFVPPQVMPNTAFVHQPSSIYHFPRTSLLKTTSFPSSGNKTTGNRSSKVALKQAQKSAAVSTAVTWIPSRVGSDFINSRTTSKFASSLPADLLNCGSLTLASDENHHPHHHSKRHPMPSDGRENLKQDLPRPLKHSSISISPMMLLRKRRASASRPFSFTTASPNRTSSTFSYVQISMPTLISSTPQHEAAYTSPRKAPAPPPVSTSPKQGQECPDKSCKLGNYCIHSISSEWGLPSPLQLNYASHLPITGEDGKQVTFGSLFESQPTIVIFIRHFWCPLCQDYMSSVNSFLGPKTTCENGHRDIKGFAALGHDAETPVRFVVISNGAHGMIAKYRQIFGLFFKVYTDPSLALYRALGMGRDGDIRKHHNRQTHRHSTSVDSSISEKNSDIGKPGEYVKHSLMGGIAMVVMRALKVGMPVWEKGGDVNQLGGEFVFGPGLTCTYAHRMQTTKGHAPIQDVLKAAGALATSTPRNSTPSSAETEAHPAKPLLPTVPDWTTSLTGSGQKERRRRESMHTFRDKGSVQSTTIKASRRRYSIGMMTLEDEEQWMEYRQDSIERLRARKDIRRGITPTSIGSGEQSNWNRQPLEIGDIIGDHRRARSDFTIRTGLAF